MVIMEKDLKAYVYAYLQETTHSARDGKDIMDLMCEFNCDRRTMEKALDQMMADDSMTAERADDRYYVRSECGSGDVYRAVEMYCRDCIAGCMNSLSPEKCELADCPLHPFRMG